MHIDAFCRRLKDTVIVHKLFIASKSEHLTIFWLNFMADLVDLIMPVQVLLVILLSI